MVIRGDLVRGAAGEGSAGGSVPVAGVPVAGVAAPEPLDVAAVVDGLAGLVSRGLGGADASGLLRVAEQARAASAWLASVELEAVSRLLRVQTREAGEESGQAASEVKAAQAEGDGWDWTVAEVACAFRLTMRQAESRLSLAIVLRDLPQVHGLLRAGVLDEYRARVIAETLSASWVTPADPAWDEVADLVCGKAPDRSHVQVRRHLNRVLLKVDPHAGARRREKALAGREVRWWAEPDGMATLQAKLSGETAAIIDTALTAMADAARDHTNDHTNDPGVDPGVGPGVRVAGTHQERRADALGEVFRSILEGRPLQVVPTATTRDRPNPTTPIPTTPSQTTPSQMTPSTTAPRPTAARAAATDAETDAAAPGAADAAESEPGAASGEPETRVPAWWNPPDLPTRKCRRPHLIVTIAETTLNGQDDEPAELAGYGPIPAEVGRQITAQATTRTTVPHSRPRPADSGQSPPSARSRGSAGAGTGSPDRPDGAAGCAASRCGTDSYTPGQALVDTVIATYPTCQAPGCSRAAVHCDLDHAIPHNAGGRTCLHNLRPLCRRHHRLKTHGGWRRDAPTGPEAEQHPPGTVIWTTRLGRRYTVPPPDRPGSPDW